MKNIEELYRIEGNGKVLLLNTNNFHWVRMGKIKYEESIAVKEKKQELENYLEKEYDLFSQVVPEPEIRSLYYSVTGRCNMSCAFCTMNSGPCVSTEKDLSLEEISDMLLPKLKKLNLKKIVITGGEPLVRKDIFEILDCFAKAFGKERIILQTNGLLLTKEIIRRIAGKIGIVEISIENIFENKALLKRMKEIFRFAGEENIALSLSFVVDSDSRKYLKEAMDICHDYHAALTTRIVSMVGRAKENNAEDPVLNEEEALAIQYEMIRYLLQKEYFEDNLTGSYDGDLQPKKCCGAFGKILAIHPDGTTYMCSNFKDTRFSMGNIRSLSIEEICEDMERKRQSSSYQDLFHVDRIKMCRECEMRYICPGPCIAEAAENAQGDSRLMSKCLSKKIMLQYAMFYHERNKSVQENLRILEKYIKDYQCRASHG